MNRLSVTFWLQYVLALCIMPMTTCRAMTFRTPAPIPLRSAPAFCTTRWSLVGRARADSDEGRQALRDLCDAYYEPVATFLRCKLRDADEARDLAHEFFAQVLAGGAALHANQVRGRFRSYLLGAVKHFLSHHFEALRRLKRGGGIDPVSLHCQDNDSGPLELPDARQLAPDAAFDRQWALTVLARGMEALREECARQGRSEFFEQAQPWLVGEAAYGDQSALAVRCGLDELSLKAAIHRIKRRFRHLVKEEIAGTLDDPALVDAELRELFAALAG